MPTVQQMIELSDTLTKTQTRIFEYMLNHPEAVCYDTLRNTAERIGVTEFSLLKVCRKLGCSGYAEMKDVFRQAGREYGVEFLYRDFRPGFREGQQQARELGLYRQKYCGCIKSFYGE